LRQFLELHTIFLGYDLSTRHKGISIYRKLERAILEERSGSKSRRNMIGLDLVSDPSPGSLPILVSDDLPEISGRRQGDPLGLLKEFNNVV
jgi:hypothetical protein